MTKPKAHITSPGRKRIPILDTKVPGVELARGHRHRKNRMSGYKIVGVVIKQSVIRNGKTEVRVSRLSDISEPAFEKNPKAMSDKFHQMLQDAVTIRAFHESEIEKGRYRESFIRLEDVPHNFPRSRHRFDHLDLGKLFDSIEPIQRQFTPQNSGGDPEKIAAALQSADLRTPRTEQRVNGHALKFPRQNVEGQTFYLPVGLYRTFNAWKLFIRHEHGIWHDELIDDRDGVSLHESLQEAWIYFVSSLRTLDAPRKELCPVKRPHLFTGVEGGNILISHRGKHWSIQLTFRQKLSRGEYRVTIKYWKDIEINDQGLRQALIELAAMSRYRDHLLEQGLEGRDSIVTRDTHIPLAFWPKKPAYPLTVDDIFYFIERVRGQG